MSKINGKCLYVSEIFESISGEVGGFPQGANCLFIRLAGCNLKCDYCDAKETQVMQSEQAILIGDIIERVKFTQATNIVITGGEPFLQKTALQTLIAFLDDGKRKISIETNGSFPIPLGVLKVTTIVMDYKLNYIEKMVDSHFVDLKSTDFIKFIIPNGMTMAYAMGIHQKLFLQGCIAQFAYSPMLSIPESVSGKELLAELKDRSKIIIQGLQKSKLNAILNLQIHKLVDMP